MATCPTCQNRFEAATFCPRDGTRLVGDVAPGALLGGRYRLIRKVGAGGMGEVYEAEHVHIHRRVAVKLLQRNLAGDPEAIERLQREAQSTSGLDHPNIVDTFDFGSSEDGQVYLVMEWLEGENLDQRLHREVVDIATALEIAAQAAAGLAEAHDRGIIHRDLKPANLFLTRDRRGVLVVKVLDFGIAKLAVHHTKLTGTGVLVGTPNYMAPEQAFGEAVDARADIYALGVIVYEMVTGAVPFHADSPLAVLHQHTSRMPVLPSARAPDLGITPELEELVMRCLAKRPDERFGSMHDLARAIDEVRHAPAQPAPRPPPPPTTPQPPPPPPPPPPVMLDEHDDDDDLLRAAGVRRGRRGVLLVVAAALLVGGAVAAWLALRDGGRKTDSATGGADAGGADAGVAVAIATDAAAGDATVGSPTTPDATVATTAVDAAATASPPAWSHEGKGKASSYSARTEVLPHTDEPFELAFVLHDVRGAVHEAEHEGTLRAEVSIAYFKDHSIVHTSSHTLDERLAFTAAVELHRPGRHHVQVTLLSGGLRVDQLRFDLLVEAR